MFEDEEEIFVGVVSVGRMLSSGGGLSASHG